MPACFHYLQDISDLMEVADRPALLSVEFSVTDLAAARSRLLEAEVGFTDAGKRLLVAPREGFGTGVQFTERA